MPIRLVGPALVFGSGMVRVILPQHLRTLANVDREVSVEVRRPVTVQALLEALELAYPSLRGTIREHGTLRRRPLVRFFACEEDWSGSPVDSLLPEKVASGVEPFFIIGAIAGG